MTQMGVYFTNFREAVPEGKIQNFLSSQKVDQQLHPLIFCFQDELDEKSVANPNFWIKTSNDQLLWLAKTDKQ